MVLSWILLVSKKGLPRRLFAQKGLFCTGLARHPGTSGASSRRVVVVVVPLPGTGHGELPALDSQERNLRS